MKECMLHAHSSIAHCTVAGLLSLQQVEETKPQQRCMTTPMPTNGRQVCISLFLICNFDLISISFFILIAVGSLPTTHHSDFWGARTLPSTTGNGAYLQLKQFLYELRCTTSSCNWSEMTQQLSTPVRFAVIFHLPDSFNCKENPILMTIFDD